jgi:hypothetical protein
MWDEEDYWGSGPPQWQVFGLADGVPIIAMLVGLFLCLFGLLRALGAIQSLLG